MNVYGAGEDKTIGKSMGFIHLEVLQHVRQCVRDCSIKEMYQGKKDLKEQV